ncbi:hypothetical protein V7S43_019096 [Phytophthora oleae]|uniref:ATP-dependent DNA helicase n=1 Tax=Phytophthora oleae TaxID=2107226 RepID=A0ABD3EWF1_9STRA
MPGQLRHLFAVLLVYCDPASPSDLWSTHLPALCEDYLHDEVEAYNNQARAAGREGAVIVNQASVDESTLTFRRAVYLTLLDIDSHLMSNGQTLTMYFESLPQFSDYHDVETATDVAARNRNRLIESETAYDTGELDSRVAHVQSLNADRKEVYDRVMDAVCPHGSNPAVPHLSGIQIFLDGPGGTGKSFLLETILASVRCTGRIALAVAGSGIAAQLLTGGWAYSTFDISSPT